MDIRLVEDAGVALFTAKTFDSFTMNTCRLSQSTVSFQKWSQTLVNFSCFVG